MAPGASASPATKATPLSACTDLRFDGSNWENLTRLVALARIQFLLQEAAFDEEPVKQCMCLLTCFSGGAFDWATRTYMSGAPVTFTTFDSFVTATRQAFGVADNNIETLCKRKLDELKMGNDIPVFFAEFDRLCATLSITGNSAKISLAESKLTPRIRQLFAEQALSFASYDTMRERLNTMWALNPSVAGQSTRKGKSRHQGREEASAPSSSKN